MTRRGMTAEELASHAVWLRRLAVSLAGEAGCADDLVQQTLNTAWQKSPEGDLPKGPWLRRVLLNVWRMYLRGEQRRSAREATWELSEQAPSPEELAQRAEVYGALIDLVRSLEEPHRHTILLRYFEGHDSTAIARLDGVAAATVRWRLQKGMQQLRAGLARAFGSEESWCLVLFHAPRVPSLPATATTRPSVASLPEPKNREEAKNPPVGFERSWRL